MPDIPEGLVPARYKGHGGISLQPGAKYYNIDGSRRKDTENKSALSLEPGDEMLWRDEDVYGKTLLHDPNGNKPSKYLGLGKVVLPEHADLTDQERYDLGYEHHMPRRDLEAIVPLEEFLKQREKATKKPKKSREVSQTITIEQPLDAPVEDGQEESEQG
jgi:hypothetical protein